MISLLQTITAVVSTNINIPVTGRTIKRCRQDSAYFSEFHTRESSFSEPENVEQPKITSLLLWKRVEEAIQLECSHLIDDLPYYHPFFQAIQNEELESTSLFIEGCPVWGDVEVYEMILKIVLSSFSFTVVNIVKWNSKSEILTNALSSLLQEQVNLFRVEFNKSSFVGDEIKLDFTQTNLKLFSMMFCKLKAKSCKIKFPPSLKELTFVKNNFEACSVDLVFPDELWNLQKISIKNNWNDANLFNISPGMTSLKRIEFHNSNCVDTIIRQLSSLESACYELEIVHCDTAYLIKNCILEVTLNDCKSLTIKDYYLSKPDAELLNKLTESLSTWPNLCKVTYNELKTTIQNDIKENHGISMKTKDQDIYTKWFVERSRMNLPKPKLILDLENASFHKLSSDYEFVVPIALDQDFKVTLPPKFERRWRKSLIETEVKVEEQEDENEKEILNKNQSKSILYST